MASLWTSRRSFCYPQVLVFARDAAFPAVRSGSADSNRSHRSDPVLRPPRGPLSRLYPLSNRLTLDTAMRRLIVCCDGTWQSAVFQQDSARLTNIARIHTAVNRLDERATPPIQQVKLYIPGPGTGEEMVIGVVAVSFSLALAKRFRSRTTTPLLRELSVAGYLKE